MRTRIAGGSLFHAASFLLRNSSAFNWLKPYNRKEPTQEQGRLLCFFAD